jgi:hypothetical protein
LSNATVTQFPEQSAKNAERVRQYLLKAHAPHKPWAYAWHVRVLGGIGGQLGIALVTWVGCGAARMFQTVLQIDEDEVGDIEHGLLAPRFDAMLAEMAKVQITAEWEAA